MLFYFFAWCKNLNFMILRLLWRPSWILAPPSWKLTYFDWLTRKNPITDANVHFYQVSCLYPDVHDYCHFPLHYKHWILIHFLAVPPQQRYSQSGRTGTSQSCQIRQPRRTPVWPTSWADPEVGTGVRTPPPPPPGKSQKYRVSWQYWSESP